MKIEKWDKETEVFDGYLDPLYRNLDHCDVYFCGNKGFAVLNHAPKYALYKRLNIPEIQDVFVLPNYRGRGIATALIRHCEDQVQAQSVGISVPVSAQFGVAQRLYHTLGYKPDGQGVVYDRVQVAYGQTVPNTDDLCIMMIKDL